MNRKSIFVLSLVLIIASDSLLGVRLGQAQNPPEATKIPRSEVVRIDAQPKKGFLYPYYLYVPPELRNKTSGKAKENMLVLPNNTGKVDDDFTVHDASAKRLAEGKRSVASKLRVVLLVPVFPRPKTDWRIYTHALDRDSLLTDKKELRRLDLQLISMIDDARARLRLEHLNLDKRVLMQGFSAAAMFTNRFTMIHPDLIKAAAFGSPGGWAMAPAPTWKGKSLRYPIGTADFKEVTGHKLDLKRLKKVPIFLYMGADDTNDSVVYKDSYEPEDRVLIFDLFGKTLIERWPITEALYKANLPAATLKLYPHVAHSETDEVWRDIINFFSTHLHD